MFVTRPLDVVVPSPIVPPPVLVLFLFHSQIDNSFGRKMIKIGMAYTSNSNSATNTSSKDGSFPASQAKGPRNTVAKKVE